MNQTDLFGGVGLRNTLNNCVDLGVCSEAQSIKIQRALIVMPRARELPLFFETGR